MATSMVPLIFMAVLCITGTIGFDSPKRNVLDNAPDNYDYDNSPGKYDDYLVVNSKRVALLRDRIMAAQQKAVEDQDGGSEIAADRSIRDTSRKQPTTTTESYVGSQCYFNPVSCFKK